MVYLNEIVDSCYDLRAVGLCLVLLKDLTTLLLQGGMHLGTRVWGRVEGEGGGEGGREMRVCEREVGREVRVCEREVGTALSVSWAVSTLSANSCILASAACTAPVPPTFAMI